MNYLESKLKKVEKQKELYLSIIHYDSDYTRKIIELIENQSTKKNKIKEFKTKSNEIEIVKVKFPETLNKFNFIIKSDKNKNNKNAIDPIISFNLLFNKGKLELKYKIYFHWRRNNRFYINFDMSFDYINNIQKVIKKIEKVISIKNEEAKEYIENYKNFKKYQSLEVLLNKLIVRKKKIEKEKFCQVFIRKMTLKELKEKMNEEGKLTIIMPKIDHERRRIEFSINNIENVEKYHLEKELENKEYKRLALMTKIILTGSFYINNKYPSDLKELKMEVEKSELGKHLNLKEGFNGLYCRYNEEEFNKYLTKCLIEKF